MTDSPDRVGSSGFDTVYAAERARVVRTAYLVVGSYAVAEELAQEAFVRLHEHFAEVENPGGFLRTAVVRLAISWRRSRRGSVCTSRPSTSRDRPVSWSSTRPGTRSTRCRRNDGPRSSSGTTTTSATRRSRRRWVAGSRPRAHRVHRALADLRKELER